MLLKTKASKKLKKNNKIKSEDRVQKKYLPDKLETFKTLQKIFRKTH